MKLLLVPQYFYPTYGGLQHFTNRLATFISKAGFDVFILSPPPEPERDIFPVLKPNAQINWQIIGTSRQEFWDVLPDYLTQDFDATLFLSIEFEELIDSQLKCINCSIQNTKRTFVRIAANGDFYDVIKDFPERLNVLSNSFALITPTQFMSDDIFKLSNKDIRPVVINNLIDYNQYHPVTPDEKIKIKAKLNLPEGIIATWSGRFDKTKNLLDLLEAWHLANVKGYLVLIGDAPYNNKEYKHEMINLINLKRIKNVIFAGHVLEYKISEFYQACDLYLCTSEKEGHSNASIEACACGLPIIGYNIPGISETAISFPSIYNQIVRNSDKQELAKAIRNFFNIREGDAFDINKCPQKSEKHSPEKVISKYINLLFS